MTAQKRGRPPSTISSSGATKTLRELGITRQQMSDWCAMARLPEAVFEAALTDQARKPTTRALVNLAKGLPANHRRGSPFTEALRAALRLTVDERRALCRAIDPDEATP